MTYSASRPDRERGFTLVEAAIALVAIAVLLAVLIPVVRERHEQREHRRLQALAEAEPWEVFEFRASHVLDPVTAHGGFVSIRCEITNPTKYPLMLPRDSAGYVLTLGDTEYVASSQVLHSPSMLDTPIGPGASLTFDSGFFPYFAGEAEVRVVYLGSEDPERVHLGFSTGDEEEDRRYGQLTFTHGILPRGEKRFQSNGFLVITEVDVGFAIPTAEEIVIRMELSDY